MSALSLSFAPLIGWPYLAGLAALGIVGVALALVARRPGALARAGALRAGAAGAGGPPRSSARSRGAAQGRVALIVEPQRQPETLADRAQQTEAARAELERKFGALDNVDCASPKASAQILKARACSRVFRARSPISRPSASAPSCC